MGVNKNFIVKNGLEVNNTLIFADGQTNRVGINTDNPQYDLDIPGEVGVSTIVVDKTLVLDGTISVGSSSGSSGQYLISTGIGVTWQSLPNTRKVQTVTASNGQSLFSVSYLVGLIDVYINGVKLSSNEYTADDGVSVVLNESCFGDETVEFIIYSTYNVSGMSTNGVTVQSEGLTVGTPGLINLLNFVGASVTTSLSGFAVTVTTNPNYWNKNSTGINTNTNVGIGTTTATSALTVSGNATISGIVTATGGFISVANTTPIQINLDGNNLIFTAVGIGSTSLTLF